MRKELLLGCGKHRAKRISVDGHREWDGLTTLDMNLDHKPDVLWDLESLPYPFKDNEFDEIHAYEVLEHLGSQGDYRSFFAQFSELWRILKPGGMLMATVPAIHSPWLWGDPGHRRAITAGMLQFLSQKQYERQMGHTAMTDYRFCYKADFEVVDQERDGNSYAFVLKAIKRAEPGGEDGHGR